MPLAVSKWRQAWPEGKSTGNRLYNTITKHSTEMFSKSIHIGILVFLKVDLFDMNLFLAFQNKIRYFRATFGTYFLGLLGNSCVFFGKSFSFSYISDNYHYRLGTGKSIWNKQSTDKVRIRKF